MLATRFILFPHFPRLTSMFTADRPAVSFYVTKFPFEFLGDVRVFAVTLLRQLIELLDQLPTASRPFICNFHIMTEINDTHGSYLAITRWRRMFAELPEKLIAIQLPGRRRSRFWLGCLGAHTVGVPCCSGPRALPWFAMQWLASCDAIESSGVMIDPGHPDLCKEQQPVVGKPVGL